MNIDTVAKKYSTFLFFRYFLEYFGFFKVTTTSKVRSQQSVANVFFIPGPNPIYKNLIQAYVHERPHNWRKPSERISL